MKAAAAQLGNLPAELGARAIVAGGLIFARVARWYQSLPDDMAD